MTGPIFWRMNASIGNPFSEKNIIRIPMIGTTIPHEVREEYAAARVLLNLDETITRD